MPRTRKGVMKLVQAKDTGKQFYLQVWLDDSKELSPGVPDSDWLREWYWGKDNALVDIRRETRLLAQAELAKMKADSTVITLPEEGQTL